MSFKVWILLEMLPNWCLLRICFVDSLLVAILLKNYSMCSRIGRNVTGNSINGSSFGAAKPIQSKNNVVHTQRETDIGNWFLMTNNMISPKFIKLKLNSLTFFAYFVYFPGNLLIYISWNVTISIYMVFLWDKSKMVRYFLSRPYKALQIQEFRNTGIDMNLHFRISIYISKETPSESRAIQNVQKNKIPINHMSQLVCTPVYRIRMHFFILFSVHLVSLPKILFTFATRKYPQTNKN